jgi:F0F1-type ATP synthase delta subunit
MKITGEDLTALEFLVTKSDDAAFIAQLDKLEQSLFNVHDSVEKKAEEIFSHEELEAVKALMKSQGVSFGNREQVRQFIHDLVTGLTGVLSINLIVAIEPTEKTLREISAWIGQNNSVKVFLNLTVDPNIIGGAVIEYNGSYRDYSLKKRVAEEEKNEK